MDVQPVAVVICAAGASSRMGGVKKEYQKLKNGATVLESAVCAFSAVLSVQIIVISVPENGEADARMALQSVNIKDEKPLILFTNGGNTRRESVFNALSVLAAFNPYYVLIHDGARPWVTSDLIEKIIAAVKKYGAVIPVVPITDTPKQLEYADQTAYIKNHLKRMNTAGAQTPQAFKFAEIHHAHEKAAEASEDFTDDAEIWGRFCGQVAVIPGDMNNKKITFPEDFT